MCRLVRQHPSAGRTGTKLHSITQSNFQPSLSDASNQLLSYANQAQFLAVSISSVESLCQQLNSDHVRLKFVRQTTHDRNYTLVH